MKQFNELSEIQFEILKYIYENNEKICRSDGYSASKISRYISCDKSDKRKVETAILYLLDLGLLNSTINKISTGSLKQSTKSNYMNYPPATSKNFEKTKYRINSDGIKIVEKRLEEMKINEAMKIMIDDDITKCDTNPSEKMCSQLFLKYKPYISSLDINITYSPDYSEYIKNTLIMFKTAGYKDVNEQPDIGSPNISIINSNSNIINIKVTFDDIKNDINTSSIYSPQKKEEILKKIDDLEKIFNDNETKAKKWTKAKTILEWVLKQSVELALKLLPLLIKVIE